MRKALLQVLVALGCLAAAGPAVASHPQQQLRFGCAVPASGLVRYVPNLALCRAPAERRVSVWPGPVWLCVRPDGLVRRVGDPRFCGRGPVEGRGRALSIPRAVPTYFCISQPGWAWRVVSRPAECPREKLLLVVANHRPTDISLSATSVAENAPVGTVVGRFGARDRDPASRFVFALVAGAGGTNNASFEIVGGRLRTRASFDFEAGATKSVRVRVSDGYGGTRTEVLAITVTDVAEGSPPTGVSLSGGSVAENQPAGTVVGSLSASDADVGDTHTFALVAGAGGTDNAQFQVVGSQLRTAQPLDFEAGATRSIRVRATDSVGGVFEQALNVSVTGVNEAPTNITLSAASVAENQPVGTVIGNVSATDPEASDTHTFALVAGAGDADNASFQIVGGVLQTAAALDFEVGASRSVRVQATDGGGLSFEKALTITITNVNEAPTDIALSGASVSEQQPVGTVVGNLSATDPDAGDSHTFSLVAGAGDTGNGSFQIVAGQLQTNAVFTLPAGPFSVRVRATDAGGLFFEEAFTITVTNVNDAPTDIVLSNATVAENLAAAAAVGTLSATDADAGDTHTFTLVAGTGDTDNARFAIAGSGLQTAQVFDFETASSFSIRVRVTDSGTPNLSFEKVFTITVTDANDAPTDIALSNSTVAENLPTATTVGTLSATDQDAGATHTFTLVAGAGDTGNGSFQISGSTLQTAVPLDFETTPSLSVRIRATDNAAGTFEEQFTITVTDANDAPVVTATAGALTYTEGDGAVAVDVGVTVTDDGATLTGATVGITAGYQSGQDVLAFANTPSISGVFTAATGTLALSGSATVAEYQAALRSVTFQNASENPSTAARTVSFQASDASLTSAAATRTITVVAVNDPPVNAVPAGQTTGEDTPRAFSVGNANLISISDADAGGANVKVTVDVNNGTLTLSGTTGLTFDPGFGNGTAEIRMTGTLTAINTALAGMTYQPAPNYNATRGAEVLTIVTDDQGASGGGALTDTDTVAITVNASADQPVAPNLAFDVVTNMRRTVTVPLPTSLDPDTRDGGYTPVITLASVTVASCAGCGISNINAAAGTFDFDPPAGQTGVFTLNYTVSDSGNPGGGQTSAAATLTMTVAGPVIWFVNPAAAGGGVGTLASPFQTLTAADAVDAANHRIFVYSNGTATGAITLNLGEWLIGQAANPGVGFDAFFSLGAVPAGTLARPALNTGTTNLSGAITLATSARVQGVSISTGAATALTGTTLTGIDVTQTALTTTTGTALSLNNVTGTVTLTDLDKAGAGTGVALTNVGAAVTIPAAASITGASVAAVDIDQGVGAVTYAGSISGSTGRTVEVTNRNGASPGLVQFTGTVTATAGTGVFLDNNDTGTVTFAGDLDLSTGANPAYTATNGGTVNVTGTGNTLATTTGSALTVTNTNIGASGLTFQSIASNGAASGIVLTNTGATAGLTVTGVGTTAGTGGTIQNSTGTGVLLTSALNTSLANMTIQTSADDGINGTSLTGFSLTGVAVTNNGNSVTDEGVELVNPAGAMVFTNVAATLNAHNHIFIDDANNIGGNSTLTMTGSSISNHRLPAADPGNTSNSGMAVAIRGDAVLGVSSISGSTFQNNRSLGLQVTGGDTANVSDLTVSGNTFQDTGTGNSQEISMDLSKAQTSSMTLKVLNNTILGHNSHGMNFFTGADVSNPPAGSYSLRVEGNTIGNNAVNNSGSVIGNGIRVNMNGGTSNRILINNNQIFETPNGRGIEVIGRNGTGSTDVTITNNTIDHTNTGLGGGAAIPLSAIIVQSNTVPVTGYTVRADVRGNVVTVPPGAPSSFDLLSTYIALVETSTSNLQLVNTASSADCTAQLVATNTATNPAPPPAVSASANAGCSLIAGPINLPS